MRKEPAVSPPEVKKRENEGTISQVRQYQLITPLFGGGTNPGEADPVTVVSGKSIRGHLRFWWRACRGGAYQSDLKRMKADEDLLWGASSTEGSPRPSQVQVVVETVSEGSEEHPFFIAEGKMRQSMDWAPLAYAAFPLQPNQNEIKDNVTTKAVRKGVSFTVKFTFPKERKEDIEAALWSWETFGGIGGRTRRGFGALGLASIDASRVPMPAPGDVKRIIQAGLEKYVVESDRWPEGVPHLHKSIKSEAKTFIQITRGYSNALNAWKELITRLKSFRQDRNRGTERNRPGRSKWPEPDAVRELTGRRSQRHSPPLSNIEKFPRAAFGLPIIFHFKDEKFGDPESTSLEGARSNRLASPLILRPLACANNEAVGLAVILETQMIPPGGIVLKGAPQDPVVETELTASEASRIGPLGSTPDVLQSFLQYLEKETRQ